MKLRPLFLSQVGLFHVSSATRFCHDHVMTWRAGAPEPWAQPEPHVLSRINRVSYGLLSALQQRGDMPTTRKLLAVPFLGKDVPSSASEFAHPDVVIGFTILAYRYEGMRL